MGKRKDPMKVFNKVLSKHDEVFRELNSGSKKPRKLFKRKKTTVDLAGSGAEHAATKQMKRMLDKSRRDDI